MMSDFETSDGIERMYRISKACASPAKETPGCASTFFCSQEKIHDHTRATRLLLPQAKELRARDTGESGHKSAQRIATALIQHKSPEVTQFFIAEVFGNGVISNTGLRALLKELNERKAENPEALAALKRFRDKYLSAIADVDFMIDAD